MVSFNLIRRPWIRCAMADTGQVQELSLAETLERSHEMTELVDSSPLVTAALHRLLLAVLHRALDGPRNEDQWGALWRRGRWDMEPIGAYLSRWEERFDLFGETQPFYQARSLKFEYEKPISLLVPELASGNGATLFDHTTEKSQAAFTPAQAARSLVAHQAFTVCGTVSLEKGQDPRVHKYTDGAPLVKSAVALVKGRTLFETLMLNLMEYDPRRDRPIPATDDDRPCWEGDEPQATKRPPLGYLDLLTWQSRRIRLQPSETASGVAITHVVIMKGTEFPTGASHQDWETMVAFRKNLKAEPNRPPWRPVGFSEDRALWRDSLALFQSAGKDVETFRPRTLTWLSAVVEEGHLGQQTVFPLDFHGVGTSNANVLLWRHERLPLPLRYLGDADLLQVLGWAVNLTEAAWRVLDMAVRNLAGYLLAPEKDGAKKRQPDRKAARALADSFSPGEAYWPHLEVPFKQFLVEAAQASDARRQSLMKAWAEKVRMAAHLAFTQATNGLDQTGRSLKALAIAQGSFNVQLAQMFKDAGIARREAA